MTDPADPDLLDVPLGPPAPATGTVLAVLTAAGSGTRLGHARPKALVPLGGEAVVVHAARRLVASGVVDALVVTAPAAHVDEVRALLAQAALGLPTDVVAGGDSRQASVAAGLAAGLALVPGTGVVLVHDAARALTPPALVVSVVDAVRAGHRAVVPGLPVTDTIKQVAAAPTAVAAGAGPAGAAPAQPVTATVDRATLRAVQTPQGFDRAVLERAHAAATPTTQTATDDAGLVEALGETVWVVPGDARALKITTAHDLAVAGLLLQEGA